MAVQIDLGKYRLVSVPPNGWRIGEVRVRKSGKSAGEEYMVHQTHPATLPAALNALTEIVLQESDARSLEELAAKLKEWRAYLITVFAITVIEPPEELR